MTFAEQLGAMPVAAKRVLALLMVFVVAGLLGGAALYSIAQVAASQDRWRAQIRRTLAYERGLAATEVTARAALTALDSNPVWQRLYSYSPGEDPTQAVQRDIVTVCAAAGVTLDSTAPLAPAEWQGLHAYGVQVAGSMSIDQLRQLLASLRAHPRYLRIEQLSVIAPQEQSATSNPILSIILAIRGYSRS